MFKMKQNSLMAKPLLQTLSISKRLWDFELRHRMKPPAKPENSTRKAKLHIFDTRLTWSDFALNMFSKSRDGMDSLIDIRKDQELHNHRTASGEAMKLLYKNFHEPCMYI